MQQSTPKSTESPQFNSDQVRAIWPANDAQNETSVEQQFLQDGVVEVKGENGGTFRIRKAFIGNGRPSSRTRCLLLLHGAGQTSLSFLPFVKALPFALGIGAAHAYSGSGLGLGIAILPSTQSSSSSSSSSNQTRNLNDAYQVSSSESTATAATTQSRLTNSRRPELLPAAISSTPNHPATPTPTKADECLNIKTIGTSADVMNMDGRVDGVEGDGWLCLAYDMRGHGESELENETDLSEERLRYDTLDVLAACLPAYVDGQRQTSRDLIVLGHSLGGAVAVQLASRLSESSLQTHASAAVHNNDVGLEEKNDKLTGKNERKLYVDIERSCATLEGVVVMDASEETAMSSIQTTKRFLQKRPKYFHSTQQTIAWLLRTGQRSNALSAELTVPSMLSNVRVPKCQIRTGSNSISRVGVGGGGGADITCCCDWAVSQNGRTHNGRRVINSKEKRSLNNFVDYQTNINGMSRSRQNMAETAKAVITTGIETQAYTAASGRGKVTATTEPRISRTSTTVTASTATKTTGITATTISTTTTPKMTTIAASKSTPATITPPTATVASKTATISKLPASITSATNARIESEDKTNHCDTFVDCLTWRTDLLASPEHWETWFIGFSQRFVDMPCLPKLLLLSHTDHLDATMMAAHMQGKFKLEVMGGEGGTSIGHFMHEDAPVETANRVAAFLSSFFALDGSANKNRVNVRGGKSGRGGYSASEILALKQKMNQQSNIGRSGR